jgi:hypothetical protein
MESADRAATMEARLRDERCLIFRNLLNGVPIWRVMEVFHKSTAQEVMDVFNFVLRKIRSWCLERMERPIIGLTIEEVKPYRSRCFAILPLLNLDRDPRYSKIMHEPLEVHKDGRVRNIEMLRRIKPEP